MRIGVSDEVDALRCHGRLGPAEWLARSPDTVQDDRQLACKATRALPEPERRSIASAQSFRCSGRFTRCRITVAASYKSVRARPSPHLEMCPLRSVSPDW